ncbi:MAG: DUF4347 domain-containing protein, partial [Pseudomonas sp.]|nr:DUF4347 domain-containing protein [Pseudomonas sp.]
MTTRNIYFIDSRVADQQTLIDSLPADSEWYLLDADEDDITQMLAVLANYSELESIQILSHGAPGTLYLGNSVLDNASLASYSDQLASLGSSLAETGDILLYGCNVAEGEQGQLFVDTLALLTGADVAASNDLTGAANLGGDWELEVTSGEVTSATLAVSDYTQTLDVITGGEGDDILVGTDYADEIDGGLGHDTLDGGAGDDSLDGNFGDDTLLGGLGNDYLRDDQGNNTLDGGDGHDSLQALSTTGEQTLIGGAGYDYLEATGQSLSLSGGEDDDYLHASGSTSSGFAQQSVANLSGGTGDDTLETY